MDWVTSSTAVLMSQRVKQMTSEPFSAIYILLFDLAQLNQFKRRPFLQIVSQ